MTLQPIPSEFPYIYIYEENFLFFFISVLVSEISPLVSYVCLRASTVRPLASIVCLLVSKARLPTLPVPKVCLLT